MGIVIHADAAVPDVRDTSSFSTVLESATAVVYKRASSGVYAAKLLEKIGRVRDVRMAPDGYIYVAVEDDEGSIFRLVPVD